MSKLTPDEWKCKECGQFVSTKYRSHRHAYEKPSHKIKYITDIVVEHSVYDRTPDDITR